MIISKTPLRISLVGGGTDMPEFYTKNGGAVVSFAIDKFIYIIVNPKFDGGTRVSYSITENVEEPEQLKHDIVRETLKQFNTRGVEVVSVSDIPGQGSGLGSSSSFAVGINLAMRKYTDASINRHPSEYAEEAYTVEREKCGHPVGKQDHYAAAYGGFRYYQFNQDGSVVVQPIMLSEYNLKMLQSNMMLFWIGKTRHSNTILKEQAKGLIDYPSVQDSAKWLGYLAKSLHDNLKRNDISDIGHILHEGWIYKKDLAMGITNKVVDNYYSAAMEAGADGGKLCGAGGSGFLLFYAKREHHSAIEDALGLRRVPFKIHKGGASIVYTDGEYV